MSNALAKTATPTSKQDPVGQLIAKLKPQMAVALPSTMNPERVARVALTELRTNPKLAEAAQSNPASFMGSMLKASALGMEVGNGLGHAYLIPFDKRAKQNGQWVTVSTEIQLIIGYRGMIELARRSGQIETLYAVEVYEGESFQVTMGLSQDIVHHRDFSGTISMTPENVIAVYAVAKLKGGMVQFDVMTTAQVEAIRSRSKSKDNGPWVTDWIEMAKKTVLRRLFKMLPVSVEVQTKADARTVSLETLANDDAGIVIDHQGGIAIEQYQESYLPTEQESQNTVVDTADPYSLGEILRFKHEIESGKQQVNSLIAQLEGAGRVLSDELKMEIASWVKTSSHQSNLLADTETGEIKV